MGVQGAGVGLKPVHVRTILESRPAVGFFEIHAENYMGAGGAPHRHLEAIREHYPLSIHGVGLSLGAARDVDPDHLARFAALVRRYDPILVSEHLAWSSTGTRYLNDLLPVPYTREALGHVAGHIDRVQTALGRRLLLENPSTYLSFEESVLEETDFLAEIVRRTGCGLLLDVNNVYVSMTNQGRDPEAYLAAYPMRGVGEIHLAGHSARMDDEGFSLLVDSHDRPVAEPVWRLYQQAIARCGPVPTLIERDADIPSWDELYGEALRAQCLMTDQSVVQRQEQFCEALLDPSLPVPEGLFGPPGSVRSQRFAVYRNNVAVGLIEALRSSFPVVNQLVGDEFFSVMARGYALRSPPGSPVLLAYGEGFPGFIAAFEPAATLPYLADVALFEWLWLEAYHAADAEPMAIERLQEVPMDRLADLKLTLHPSARFMRFSHPVLAVWLAHQQEGGAVGLEIGGAPEQLVLVRPCADVHAIVLSPGALAFLRAIQGGMTIAGGVTRALEEEPAIRIADLLSTLFHAGAFIGFVEEEVAA